MFSRRIVAKKGLIAEIPCIFPCQREFDTPGGCELNPRPSRQGADRWGTEHARNTHTRLAASESSPRLCAETRTSDRSAYSSPSPKSAALVAGLAIARATAPRLTKIGAEIAASQPSAASPGQMFDLTR